MSSESQTLPVDEQMLLALQDAGFDEGEAVAALEVVIPILAADVRAAANEAAWTHRSMTFYRGGGSDTKLHPIGGWLRDRFAYLFPPGMADPS